MAFSKFDSYVEPNLLNLITKLATILLIDGKMTAVIKLLYVWGPVLRDLQTKSSTVSKTFPLQLQTESVHLHVSVFKYNVL